MVDMVARAVAATVVRVAAVMAEPKVATAARAEAMVAATEVAAAVATAAVVAVARVHGTKSLSIARHQEGDVFSCKETIRGVNLSRVYCAALSNPPARLLNFDLWVVQSRMLNEVE